MEDKVIGFSSKNKKNPNAKIEIISSKNKENICNQFCFANTKGDILERFVSQLFYSQIKELMLLLDTLNMEEYKQKKIVVRVDDTYCEHT